MRLRCAIGCVLPALALVLFTARMSFAQNAAPFACPATLSVTEQPQVPYGWSGVAANSIHPFKNLKVLNGNPGKEEYDLKPDDEMRRGRKVTLSWNLKDYRDMNLFIRCSYRDTESQVTTDLPARLTVCSVTLEFNTGNQIIGNSQMECH